MAIVKIDVMMMTMIDIILEKVEVDQEAHRETITERVIVEILETTWTIMSVKVVDIEADQETDIEREVSVLITEEGIIIALDLVQETVEDVVAPETILERGQDVTELYQKTHYTCMSIKVAFDQKVKKKRSYQ